MYKNILGIFSLLILIIVFSVTGCGGSGAVPGIEDQELLPEIDELSSLGEISHDNQLISAMKNMAPAEDVIIQDIFSNTDDISSAPKKAGTSVPYYFALNPKETVYIDNNTQVNLTYDFIFQKLTKPVDDPDAEIVPNGELSGTIIYKFIMDTQETKWKLKDSVAKTKKTAADLNPEILKRKNNITIKGSITAGFPGTLVGPVVGAKVSAVNNDYPTGTAVTNSKGAYSIKVFANSKTVGILYNVIISADNFASLSVEIEAKTSKSVNTVSRTLYPLNKPSATLTGIVKDHKGNIAQNASVFLLRKDGSITTVPGVMTDTAGVFLMSFVNDSLIGELLLEYIINAGKDNEQRGLKEIELLEEHMGTQFDVGNCIMPNSPPVILSVALSNYNSGVATIKALYNEPDNDNVILVNWTKVSGEGTLGTSSADQIVINGIDPGESVTLTYSIKDNVIPVALQSSKTVTITIPIE